MNTTTQIGWFQTLFFLGMVAGLVAALFGATDVATMLVVGMCVVGGVVWLVDMALLAWGAYEDVS